MKSIKAKKLVHSVQGGQSWFGVEYNTNIYRGCNHGCIYCDSRSSCYGITDFDTIRVKENASTLIDHELSKKRKKGILGFGSMSDPYNRFEDKVQETRQALIACNKYQFGVHLITKMQSVVRDIDVLRDILNHSSVNVSITITTADALLQKQIEPYASTTQERFDAIQSLAANGIYCGVLLMPMLPYINDNVENIDTIIQTAKECGANYVYPSFGVTLRDNQRQYFLQHIDPTLADKYIKQFGYSYNCQSPHANVLQKKFNDLCNKYGIVYKMEDIVKESFERVKQQQQQLF